MNHLLQIVCRQRRYKGLHHNLKRRQYSLRLQALDREHCPETGHSLFSTWELSREELNQSQLECLLPRSEIKPLSKGDHSQ
jgi:hypothetical protein